MSDLDPAVITDAGGGYLTALLELGNLLCSSLDLDVVLNTAVEQVIPFVGAERGFILLTEGTDVPHVIAAQRGVEPQDLAASLAPGEHPNPAEISRTVVEHVLTGREPLLTHNAMSDPRFASRQSVQLTHLRSVLCVPLLAQGKLLGLLYVDNRMQTAVFADVHLEMLSAFAHQAAIAIENARLYDNLRRSLEDRLKLQDELYREESKRLLLEEAAKLKSDFIGVVAHELKNPLTGIRGYAQTLNSPAEWENGELRDEFLTAIQVDCDRLLLMISELLDVSRLEAGRSLPVHVGRVNVAQLLERVARQFRHDPLHTGRHTLTVSVADDAPASIHSDEGKVLQVVANLVSNALKYSPDGGQVVVRARAAAGCSLAISVSDEGVGLTEADQQRLFRQYDRIERDAIRNIAGTGIGLYLSGALAALLGGDITCTSAQGRGSTFTLTLPPEAPSGQATSAPDSE